MTSIAFSGGLFAASLAAQPLNVSVQAKAAILYNPENGAILYEKNSKEPYYPASIAKIATALFVLDTKEIDLETPFIASSHALEVLNASIKQANPQEYPPYILEHDGVMIGIKKGEKLSLSTLLHALILYSSNDAANVLAEGCSGSVSVFMEEMNAYLREKGIIQTRFQNPHGLHHPAQLTTAYDMAKIAGLAFENPVFKKIAQTPSYDWPGHRKITNSNRLLKEGDYRYPPTLGGKTGYTANSEYNLVAAAEEKGRRLIAVLLGCKEGKDRYKDAIALFEAAFREKPQTRPLFSKKDAHFSKEMPKSDRILKAHLIDDLDVMYFPSEEAKLKASLHWHKLKLPIKEGDQVGKIVVEDERGNVVASAPLFAENQIKKTGDFPSRLPWILLPFGIVLFFFLKLHKKSRKLLK